MELEYQTQDIATMPKVAPSMFKDLVAGFVSGAMAIYVGHPLDTIKVKMQVSEKNRSFSSVMNKIYVKEGLKGMFKGVASPVISRAPVSAVVFATNDKWNRGMANWNTGENTKALLSGVWAGFASIPLVTPADVLKVQKQGAEGKGRSYLKIIKRAGLPGMFSGFAPTFCRDVPSYGVYFGAYSYAKSLMGTDKIADIPNKQAQYLLQTAIAGGWAGCSSWMVCYPMDVIKTTIQYHPHHKSMLGTFKHLYRRYGIKKFYKGYIPTVIRAFPTNAVMFVAYDYTTKLLDRL